MKLKNTLLPASLAGLLLGMTQPTFADDHKDETGHAKNTEQQSEAERHRHHAERERHHQKRKHLNLARERHRLEQVDANKDGAIDKAEFMAHAQSRFEMMDADGDQVITQEERAQAAKEMKATQKEAMRAARKAYRESKRAD